MQTMEAYWSRETIDWYVRASRYTGYHRKVAGYLAPWLADCETVCDLGCGPGCLALALAPHCRSLTALDRDEGALAALERENREGAISVLRADAMALPESRCWDGLVLSFFGRIMEGGNLDYFLSHCRKTLILIVAGEKSPFRQKESAPEVAEFLHSRHRSFHMELHSPEFGQPLRDLRDAAAFAARYAPPDSPLRQEEGLRRALEPLAEGGWYLPHEKKLGIFVIPKEESQ